MGDIMRGRPARFAGFDTRPCKAPPDWRGSYKAPWTYQKEGAVDLSEGRRRGPIRRKRSTAKPRRSRESSVQVLVEHRLSSAARPLASVSRSILADNLDQHGAATFV